MIVFGKKPYFRIEKTDTPQTYLTEPKEFSYITGSKRQFAFLMPIEIKKVNWFLSF